MSLISWTGTLSGLWSTGSNWSTGNAPQNGDDVQIEPTAAITVTYNTGSLFLDQLATANATLSVTGGTLNVLNGYDFGGALAFSGGLLELAAGNGGDAFGSNVTETGGVLRLQGGALAQGGTFTETAGTLAISNGQFLDHDAGAFSGAVSGDGRLILDDVGGQITLGSGFSASVGAIEIQNTEVSLSESLTYAKTFALDQGGTLGLNGYTLTLKGSAGLNGTITNGGVINATGTGHMNGLLLDNGVDLSVSGTYTQAGNIALGSAGSATLAVAKSGTLQLSNNGTIFADSSGSFSNAGLLIKTGGGSANGESVIEGNFSNATSATVDIAVGTLDFRGPSNGFTDTLAGTFTGGGSLSFDAGSFLDSSTSNLDLAVSRLLLTGNATTLTLTTSLTYDGNWDQTGGTLVVGSPGQGTGSLTLNGETAFDGGLLKGTGTVLATGAVNLGANMDLEGNITCEFQGPVSQTGNINLGTLADAITIASVAAGDSWDVKANSSIFGFNGEIENAGTFALVSGGGTSVVQSGLISTGTVAVDSGVLALSGVGTLGGSVTGSAALDISGAYVFASGLALSVGTVILDAPANNGEVQVSLAGNLTFANNWAQEGGTLSLQTGQQSGTLTLEGIASLEAGAIEGDGTVLAKGATVIGTLSLLQGAQLVIDGNAEQTGNVTLTGGSTAPTLTVGSSGVYTMDAATTLGGQNNSVVGTVVVDGTLVLSGAGVTEIAASLVDNGSIKMTYGEMAFLGSVTGTGSMNISNGATLDLLGSTTITNTLTFGSHGGILDLGTPDNFLGTIAGFATGDMVELNGFAFGGGSLVVQNDTVTITDGNDSVTLTFSTAQTLSQLEMGVGPHGWLALIHT
jgi:hypothetical protein